MSISQEVKPEVRFGKDNMEAYLTLPPPPEGQEYSVRELMQILDSKGVKYGVDQEMLIRMISEKTYRIERRVAVGEQPVEGYDGYYEFLFNREFNRTPKELPDGGVDYRSINVIATVNEGDQIALYHPCVQGKNGFNVKGGIINAKRCKELQPLRGKGFMRSENGEEYYAEISGKIDFVNERLIVSPVYEIPSDVDMHTGNVDFNGDVVIHGAVKAGMSIKATGTVTIDGIVEAADITAGKDIVLKSGLMGNSHALLITKGNLYAKFVEYTNIDVRGNINAESLLSCDVVCGEKVIIEGKHGSIVGGIVRAVGGVVVNSLGNEVELRTEVAVGAEGDVYRRYKMLEQKLANSRKQLEIIDEKIKEIDKENSRKSVMDRPKSDPRKVSLLRSKIHENSVLQEDQLEKEELESVIARAEGANIQVLATVHPGTCVRIDESRLDVKTEQFSVKFVKRVDKIHMERITEASI
ncbi:MAG: DUF342 domain-containing protein [Lachnospiraceae bacterium]|jgi:hypothetical protein|nr:DUF342 domain-containing protein [Lachnospiraceae bacterium]